MTVGYSNHSAPSRLQIWMEHIPGLNRPSSVVNPPRTPPEQTLELLDQTSDVVVIIVIVTTPAAASPADLDLGSDGRRHTATAADSRDRLHNLLVASTASGTAHFSLPALHDDLLFRVTNIPTPRTRDLLDELHDL
jgi:hypothetical protein